MAKPQPQNVFKRQAISLETKIKILDYLKRGKGPTSVGKAFGLSEATIRTIKKNEKSIRQSIISGSKLSSKTTSYSRNPILENTEKYVVIWIEDLLKKRIPIEGKTIKEKALRIYHQLQALAPAAAPPPAPAPAPSTSQQVKATKKLAFNASEGWLTGFLKRHAFHNVKGEVASPDENAAKSFPHKLASIIEEGGYTPDQIFNADETGLFWRKMPESTYIAKAEKSASGCNAATERVTFLFCTNASGDKMLKPLLVNKSPKPRALKGTNIKQLPVHLMANRRAWLTADLFGNWFSNCFVPEVQRYVAQKGLEFKILLLVDCVPSHPVVDYPNIQLLFLPPNTASLIQPLNQGILATFKMYYIKQVFKYILDSVVEGHLPVVEAWNNFTIVDCIAQADLAIKQLRQSTLNACWEKLLPACVKSESFVVQKSDVCAEIITLSKAIGGEGFDNMQPAHIDALMRESPLDEDDLFESTTVYEHGGAGNDEVGAAVQLLTADLIHEGLIFATSMEQHFLSHDPDTQRALKFQRNLKFCIAGYEELFKQLEKQSKKTAAIKRLYSKNNRKTSLGR